MLNYFEMHLILTKLGIFNFPIFVVLVETFSQNCLPLAYAIQYKHTSVSLLQYFTL